MLTLLLLNIHHIFKKLFCYLLYHLTICTLFITLVQYFKILR
jgi:hypothetical protein